jgi:hypothetical protein
MGQAPSRGSFNVHIGITLSVYNVPQNQVLVNIFLYIIYKYFYFFLFFYLPAAAPRDTMPDVIEPQQKGRCP